jgi:uncharacterized membrane protein YczE
VTTQDLTPAVDIPAVDIPAVDVAGPVRMSRRLAQLCVGLVLYGLGMALQIRATLGLDPWDVLHQGLTRWAGLSFGTIVIATSLVVLLIWIPLRQRPGIGTILNTVIIGVVVDAALAVLPEPRALALRWTLLLAGVLVGGLATGCYIGAGLGTGPRDGLMTGFTRRTGRSIRLIRTLIELTVLAAGIALGGSIGPGTVIYALAIGPLAQLFLTRLRLPARKPPRPATRAESARISQG